MDFRTSHVSLFMGGSFNLGQPSSVADLRRVFREIDTELAGWGDDTEIREIVLANGLIQVTLSHGIPE